MLEIVCEMPLETCAGPEFLAGSSDDAGRRLVLYVDAD
jgi:hypothetical protein